MEDLAFLALVVGSLLVAPFGAFTTRVIKHKYMHFVIGLIIAILGIWTLVKAWV